MTNKQNQFQQILKRKVKLVKQNFHILLAFLLITITLLIPVKICYFLMKRQSTQKHLLPVHVAINKPK